MPDSWVMNAGHGSGILLLEFLDLAGVHVKGGLHLLVVELWPPDLSLGVEGVEKVLGPVQVVA